LAAPSEQNPVERTSIAAAATTATVIVAAKAADSAGGATDMGPAADGGRPSKSPSPALGAHPLARPATSSSGRRLKEEIGTNGSPILE
jgi:hypothetical protein